MHKLLLTLVAFSSGVLCNVAQNLTEGSPTADSALGGINLQGGRKEFYNGVNTCCRSSAPQGYVATSNIGAHKLHKYGVTWNKARKSCMDEGGQLAILKSVGEAAILLNWMKRENIEITWLGVHDHFDEGDWLTLKGETLEAAGYDTWNTRWPNQPDNYGGNENCGVLIEDPESLKSSGLGDVRCDQVFPYFCKIILC